MKVVNEVDLFSITDKTQLPFQISKEIESSYLWDEQLNAFLIRIPNGELIFSENFFSQKTSNRSVEYFQENDLYDWKKMQWHTLSTQDLDEINFTHIRWKQDKVRMYGKTIPLPRLTSWYGDSEKSYTYSGIKAYPNEWNKGLLYIKNKVEGLAQTRFNSVLLNWYRNGEDSVSWHADDEKELGKNPIIASANFGESRDFIIRKNDDHSKKITIPLKHGTCLIMRGEIQHFWQHSVPKRKQIEGSRFNLTFRRTGIGSA